MKDPLADENRSNDDEGGDVFFIPEIELHSGKSSPAPPTPMAKKIVWSFGGGGEEEDHSLGKKGSSRPDVFSSLSPPPPAL